MPFIQLLLTDYTVWPNIGGLDDDQVMLFFCCLIFFFFFFFFFFLRLISETPPAHCFFVSQLALNFFVPLSSMHFALIDSYLSASDKYRIQHVVMSNQLIEY